MQNGIVRVYTKDGAEMIVQAPEGTPVIVGDRRYTGGVECRQVRSSNCGSDIRVAYYNGNGAPYFANIRSIAPVDSIVKWLKAVGVEMTRVERPLKLCGRTNKYIPTTTLTS